MMAQESLNDILVEGAKKLALNLGIVSNINGETYIVHICENNDMDIKPDDIFELSQTYCRDVIEENTTKHYQDVAQITEMLKHPCYLNTQLRAYIGTPITVHGKTWGTLNYSSLFPRNNDYSQADIAFLESQSRAVGAILETQ